MDTKNNIKLAFEVETDRLLKLMTTEIYDSPLALLRENLQNAYDAILMRIQEEGSQNFLPLIKIEINGKVIHVTDNGVGMNLETLKNNFWRAGSSGKRNNAIAQKAGVIGTFGIGAMANFGVSKSLEVITTSTEKIFTYHSKAIKENLKIGEECIDTLEVQYNGNIGTQIIAILDDNLDIDLKTCIEYLKPYVEYLPIPVTINGVLHSQKNILEQFDESKKKAKSIFPKQHIKFGGFNYELESFVLANSFVFVKIVKLQFNNKTEIGNIFLYQGATSIMCYRNYFGLSSILISKYYNLGGFVNLSFLSPTAGREALNRDSISILNSLLDSIEYQITLLMSNVEISNLNTSFQKYIVANNLLALGKNLTIRVSPQNSEILLSSIPDYNKSKTKSYYTGVEMESVKFFANETNDLFLTSHSTHRKQIQLFFLKLNKIKEQVDDIVIIKVYDERELSLPEQTIQFKIQDVIEEDYLVKDLIILFAEISLGVTSKLEKEKDNDTDSELLKLLISKTSPSINHLIHIYNTDYELLMVFVKDYVREELYPRFSQYVPSATKSGAEALHQMLLKTKELFKIDIDEQGDLESLLRERQKHLSDKSEITKKLQDINKEQVQTVKINQIGSIEEKIPDLIYERPNESKLRMEKDAVYTPMPPMLREELNIGNIKLLRTPNFNNQLNNFRLFIALGDRIYKMDKDFFYQPHTTKIIWGNHKIIYIFGHISNKITLYYEVQLKEPMNTNPIGGAHFLTTTIITKDKIFIPIPEILESAFYLDKIHNSKEYYIRFNLVTDLG